MKEGRKLANIHTLDVLDLHHLPLLDVQQVETVVIAHGEELASVNHPDQLDDSTETQTNQLPSATRVLI